MATTSHDGDMATGQGARAASDAIPGHLEANKAADVGIGGQTRVPPGMLEQLIIVSHTHGIQQSDEMPTQTSPLADPHLAEPKEGDAQNVHDDNARTWAGLFRDNRKMGAVMKLHQLERQGRRI